MTYSHLLFNILCHGVPIIILAGCTGTRHYDKPSLIHAPPTGRSELIPYRKLERADFRALSRPAPLSNASIAAVCTQIVLAPEVRFHVQPISMPLEVRSKTNEMSILNPGFRAVVNPRCSWWKAGLHAQKEILEHEQVHFAIVELHARRLNRRIAEHMRRANFSRRVSLAAIREFSRETTQEILEMHRRFDEEMFYETTLATTWLAKLEAALRRTASYAR